MEQLHLDLGEKAYDIIFEQDFARLPDCLVAIQAPQKLLLGVRHCRHGVIIHQQQS